MSTLRFELVLGPVEFISIFDSDNEYLIEKLPAHQKEIFNNFKNLVGNNFILLENIEIDGLDNVNLTVYYYNTFNHDANYSIDKFYPRKTLDYNNFSTNQKMVINAFVELINILK